MWRALIGGKAAPAETAAPLAPGEIENAFAAFTFSKQKIALAVSGGPDSMALAFCAKRWALAKNIFLHAFIVDHALRPESAREAAQVKTWLEAMQIPATVLRWEHLALATRIHITARKARYELLANASIAAGTTDLLLAHQREDQAETVLMRLAKGTGIDGLAGMAVQNNAYGIRLLRPLLGFGKDRLIATCRAHDVPFVSDASNASTKFARGRLRRILPLLADEGLTVDRLTEMAQRAADAKDALDQTALKLVRVATKRDAAGTVRFDLEQLRSAPSAIAQRALVCVLQNTHGEDYAPEHASLARLHKALCADDEMPPRTLHGCVISKTGTSATIMREYAAITDDIALHPGCSILWDTRWQVRLPKDAGKTFAVRALGNPPHDELDRLVPGLRHAIPQGRARSSLPALWEGNNLRLIPHLTADGTWDSASAQLLKAWPPSTIS